MPIPQQPIPFSTAMYPDIQDVSSKLVFCWWPTVVDNNEVVWLKWVRQFVLATEIHGRHVEVTYCARLVPHGEWEA
jgi:hypothetical protein